MISDAIWEVNHKSITWGSQADTNNLWLTDKFVLCQYINEMQNVQFSLFVTGCNSLLQENILRKLEK